MPLSFNRPIADADIVDDSLIEDKDLDLEEEEEDFEDDLDDLRYEEGDEYGQAFSDSDVSYIINAFGFNARD